jgi:hypothetical protein
MKTVFERFTERIKDFKTRTNVSKKASGIDEEYTEYDQLLQDIHDRKEDVKARKEEEKLKQVQKKQKLDDSGSVLREQATRRLSAMEHDKTWPPCQSILQAGAVLCKGLLAVQPRHRVLFLSVAVERLL